MGLCSHVAFTFWITLWEGARNRVGMNLPVLYEKKTQTNQVIIWGNGALWHCRGCFCIRVCVHLAPLAEKWTLKAWILPKCSKVAIGGIALALESTVTSVCPAPRSPHGMSLCWICTTRGYSSYKVSPRRDPTVRSPTTSLLCHGNTSL